MFILNYNLEPRNKVKSQSQQSMQVNIQLWFALSGVLVLVNSIIHISELFRKWKSMRAAGKCAIACALTRRRVGANQPIPAAIWVSFTWHSTLADSTLVNMLACSPVSTATPSLPFLRVLNGSASICFLSLPEHWLGNLPHKSETHH